jgi:DNA binding domain, excisionase family|nr:MAG TPA: helix-turn-helix domain protein [Bacteriophage sp.]
METNMLIQISPEQLSEMIISGIREELQKFQSVSGEKSNNKDLMTRKEVCDYLQCSQTSLWDWTRKGKISATKVGKRKVLYRKKDVDTFLNEQVSA